MYLQLIYGFLWFLIISLCLTLPKKCVSSVGHNILLSAWNYNTNTNNMVRIFLFQRRRNGFQSGIAMKYWKVQSATMVGRQRKLLNSRRSRMAKTITFWPWRQPFNSFYFETLSFFPLVPFFLSATQKSVWGEGGGYMPTPLLRSPWCLPALFVNV